MVEARSNLTERLPIPPPFLARFVELAADPNVETSRLAAVLKNDPVLSARVIGLANSSFHSPRSPVATVERAVSFLGLRAVRNIVLCVGVKKLYPEKELHGFPLERFWESSLRRASAARCLAVKLGLPHPDELFAIGLCQDLGILKRARLDPAVARGFARSLAEPSDERRRAESLASEPHDRISGVLLRYCSFPEDLVVPVEFHHAPEEAPESQRKRARVCHAAETITDVFEVEDKARALRAAEASLVSLGLAPEALPELVSQVAAAVKEAASLLEFRVGAQPSYQEIATTACEGMFELNVSYEELTRRLKEALEAKDRLADELKRLNEELAARALTDSLTGLANRRAFDDAFAREVSQSQRSSKPLSLLIVDIDHFKRVNDTHGHAAGDEVLRHVARAILASVRATDTAARQGGEEFAVILPFTADEQARIVAERIRKNVAAMRVPYEGKELGVTVSLGGVSVVATKEVERGAIVNRADAALYQAKSSGRDRVVWSA
jgi:diguanylate cyclase (GGDEF)-like protein